MAIAVTTSATAGGFSLYGEANGRNAGDYGAGVAAEAIDASTLFYNPAGLTRLEKDQVVVSATYVGVDSRFTGYSRWFSPAFPDMTYKEPASGLNGASSATVPSIFYAKKVNAAMAWGIGVFVPFGLETNWSKKSPVRYAATRTSLKIVDVSPALATKLTNTVSFGGGLDMQFATVDFNSVAGIPIAPPSPASNDSPSLNHGTSVGVGAHAGLLFEPNAHTRVGINYQSLVNHHFFGSSTMTGALTGEAGKLTNNNLFSDPVNMPARTTLSAYRDINNKLSLMGTLAYIQWSTIQQLTLNGVVTPIENIRINVRENFKNTWRAVGGAKYRINEKVLIRGGVGFDQTPVKSAKDRNLRLPDGSRVGVAIGGHYQMLDSVGIDVGWTHLFMQTVSIDNVTENGLSNAIIKGNVHGHANLFGAQVTWDIA